MLFPDYRPRRLRRNSAFRRLIRETRLSADDLIQPVFAVGGKNVKNPIPSMPGQFQLSIDNVAKLAKTVHDLNIPAIILFGLPDKKGCPGNRCICQKRHRAAGRQGRQGEPAGPGRYYRCMSMPVHGSRPLRYRGGRHRRQ